MRIRLDRSGSGADTDKFARFKLTPAPARLAKAPLINERLANIECKVIDIVEKHNIVVLEAVAAYIDTEHARRSARFTPWVMEPSLWTGAKLIVKT